MEQPCIAKYEVTRYILKTFGLHASKRLGQNFLISPDVVQAIVEAAEVQEGDRILEIGPGIGTLTQGLLEAGAQVTAVELDKKLPDVLAETLAGYENFHLVRADILKTDIHALMGVEPFKVVANLPYYITTPILMTLLERRLPMERIVTMVQKEVAERMIASPGSKAYGALSVAVQYYTEPHIECLVPAQAFFPPPEVESAVIVGRILSQPPVPTKDEAAFFRVVRAAFGQRRKTLRKALTATGKDKQEIVRALQMANIDPARRGETLSLAEFARLAEALF